MKHTRSVLPAMIAVFVCWSLLIQGCGKPEPPKETPITAKSDEANVKAMVDKIANWNSNSIWLAIMQRMVRTGKLK